MAPRKLSDSDKKQITQIYCQRGETTSTLASKFGVSSSTVSRVLKQILSEDDYTQLMQWKRGGERGDLSLNTNILPSETAVVSAALKESDSDSPQVNDTSAEDSPETQSEKAKKSPSRRSRRRSTSAKSSTKDSGEEAQLPLALPENDKVAAVPTTNPDPVTESEEQDIQPPQSEEVTGNEAAAWVSEDLDNEDDYADDDEDDGWEDDEWEEETDDDNDTVHSPSRAEELAILSFSDFSVKKPCYLVVDRLAELITCPLKEFSELGIIPAGEEQARTLPVFDNHRIARRFARRNQRIIKVPNGSMLSKTQDYLQAKGITRILFDGQVYALN
ncbi:transposase [Oscillatoria sp. CS-180]|uniref:helix-turn-helix domain-containing protein n=1 Tax=Oscillatoria sp. CS-180 TaxID=3021720 RepID=UPI00232E454E|nr:helix-turn-helix domain-containing protein [Oscillatoria sp. CS-180]MDB9528484.1 transposase [Oscillatoria sp. CS-180]